MKSSLEPAGTVAGGDAERRELRRQRLVRGLQALERADHVLAAGELAPP